LVPVAIANQPAFHHEVLEDLRVLLFCFLEPESKAESFFSGHLAVGICLCYRAAFQEKRAPGTVPAWGCLQFVLARGRQLVELPLPRSFSLRQFLEPGQVLALVLDAARSAIAHELQDEPHLFQRRIEAHQQERIELRLERVRVDDLVVALPIVDLSFRERMERDKVERSLVFGCSPVILRSLNRMEVLIERDVEFGCQNVFWVKGVLGRPPSRIMFGPSILDESSQSIVPQTGATAERKCPWRIGTVPRFSAMSHCYSEAKQQFANHTSKRAESSAAPGASQDPDEGRDTTS